MLLSFGKYSQFSRYIKNNIPPHIPYEKPEHRLLIEDRPKHRIEPYGSSRRWLLSPEQQLKTVSPTVAYNNQVDTLPFCNP